jgi:outer membrane protein assembly factor BamB
MTLRVTALILLLSAGTISAQQSADWTQWRGPNRDGSIPSFKAPATWPAQLTSRWTVEIGTGYSTPLIVGERVFTFSRQGDDEVVMALEAGTGRIIWSTRYPAPYTLVAAAKAHGMGPKATPVFADGRLFTFGISGILSAFDAATGKQLWQKPAPAVGPTFTTSQSPIYERGVLIAHVGGNDKGALTAFEPATGKVLWEWTGDGPAYGSPVIADIGGVRQVITFTFRNLVGVSAETGQLLWQRPFRSRSDVNSMTPIVNGSTIIVSGGDAGVLAVNVSRKGTQWVAEDAWHNTDTFFQYSNLALIDGALFGLSATGRGTYVIIDAASGKMLWTGEPRAADNAAFQKAGSLLLVLEADGELLVVDGRNKAGFSPMQRYKVAEAATWPAPAISGNRIFVKDLTTLTLWTIG